MPDSHATLIAELERLRGLWAEARAGTAEALAEARAGRASVASLHAVLGQIDHLARQALEA